MNQFVVDYYESIFKNEIMIMQLEGTTKTLKELAAEFVIRDEAHSDEILTAYANVRKEVIGS